MSAGQQLTLRQSCRTLDRLQTFGFGILTSEVGSFPVPASRSCVLRARLGGCLSPVPKEAALAGGLQMRPRTEHGDCVGVERAAGGGPDSGLGRMGV